LISSNFKRPGLRYEEDIYIQNGWICLIKGPFFHARHGLMSDFWMMVEKRTEIVVIFMYP
jgi:hypothetical protein